MANYYKSALELIGKTPLVEVSNLERELDSAGKDPGETGIL